MSYIAPNTKVILCRGVPLDSGYNHTFWFATEQEQYNKLSSYAKFTDWQDTSYTYQRANKGSLRVKHKADDLYDVNYLMFQNTSFGNKWFYAFVTSVDYDNDVTTTINYQIDVMQTWYFDYRLGNCFVEREHSSTDVMGDNIVDEGIGIPDYVSLDTTDYVYTKDTANNRPAMALCIYYIAKDVEITGGLAYKGIGWTTSPGSSLDRPVLDNPLSTILNYQKLGRAQIFDGVVSPVNIFVVPLFLEDTPSGGAFNYTLEGTKNWLRLAFQLLENNSCQVVSCVQMPYNYTVEYIRDINGNKIFSLEAPVLDTTISLSQPTVFKDDPNDTNGYTPKNKKVYTYPFQALVVSNNSGEDGTFRWEDFYVKNIQGHPVPQFRMVASPFLQPHLSCIPKTYKGREEYFESAINFEAFPQPAFSVDSFNTWWQQNKTSLALGAVSSAVKIGLNHYAPAAPLTAAQKNFNKMNYINDMGLENKTPGGKLYAAPKSVRTDVSAMSSVLGLVGSIDSAAHVPNTASGNILTDTLLVKLNKVGFTFYMTACKKEYAQMVDSFFTMFGYAQKKNKVPSISNIHKTRQNWNYIKCSTAVIHSVTNNVGQVLRSLPADAEEEIASIYEGGITFWKKELEPGEYGDGTNPISIV